MLQRRADRTRRDAPSLGQALFSPQGIALVGASGDVKKHASLPQRYLKKHGYTGRVYPINPHRADLFGEPAFPSVSDVPEQVDHAFIMVRTDSVLDAVRDCIAAGVVCATILSDGFAEAGAEGQARQRELTALAKDRIRILGPNSLGLINTHAPLALSANEVLELPALLRGRIGLISQSGSLLGALLSRGQGRGTGFSVAVSVGNELDLGVGEIGELMIDDPNTDAILLFLEAVRDRERLAAMARRAYAVGKPVVAYTLGRSSVGQKLASSHTGALAGSGAALAAFLRDHGIVHVDMFETLLEIPRLLMKFRPLEGKRVSVMSTTGGGGALMVDNLSLRGVDVAPPGPRAVGRLAQKGIRIENKPLTDLTLAGTNAETYGAVLDEFLESAACDAIVAVVGSSSQFRPDRAVQPIVAAAGRATKPIAVFMTPQADESIRKVEQAGIAAFRTPEACADGIRSLFAWRPPRMRPSSIARPDAAARLLRQESAASSLGSRLLSALGIPLPATVIIAPDSIARIDDAALAGVRFPVALKVVSPDIPHKTEAGGVALGVASLEALRAAAGRMLNSVRQHCPHARIDGFEVQTMESGLAEVLIGYRVDPQVGPTITIGSGGVLSELLRDFATRTAPISVDEVAEMIGEVRSLQVLTGFRSLPKGDVDALARTIGVVSSLALIEDAPICEFEINPLLVKRDGVVALDALVVCDAEGGS